LYATIGGYMNIIIKVSAIIFAYLISFGLLCPWLVSLRDDFGVILGISAVVLTVSTLPAAIHYVMNLFNVETGKNA